MYAWEEDVDSPQILLWQVFFVLAVAFAARGCEIKGIVFEDIKRVVMHDKSVRYAISYYRRKQKGSKEKLDAFIVGETEVGIIDRYVNLLPHEERTDRFFRKLLIDKRTQRYMWLYICLIIY